MALSYCLGGVSTMIATYVQAMGKIVPSMVIQVLRQGGIIFQSNRIGIITQEERQHPINWNPFDAKPPHSHYPI